MANEPSAMQDEIMRLVEHIETAKKEIFSIGATERSSTSLTDASQHLDAVIKATEEASNSIMDAADAIQAAASGMGGDREQKIKEATTRIYEACNFQDISGQRITKVIRLLDHIEERILALNSLFGKAPKTAKPANDAPLADQDLLEGPQLPSKGTSQADIDALFAGGKN